MQAYATNGNRLKAYSLLAVFSVILSILITYVAEQLHLASSWIVAPPSLAGVYGILYSAVNQDLWRWRPLRTLSIIDEIPIAGTYKGELISNYQHKECAVRLIIDQTWTNILIQFDVTDTQSSTSLSRAASCENLGNGSVQLTYTYGNTPSPGIADADMADHDGTAILVIKPNGEAVGRYYNARGRKGSMFLQRSEEQSGNA